MVLRSYLGTACRLLHLARAFYAARQLRGVWFYGTIARAVLTENHIKEGLSRAYIHGVAMRAGFNCSLCEFDYGIDGTFVDVRTRGHRRVESGFKIDFQAKASVGCNVGDTTVAYDLEAKSHHDLIDDKVGTPRILIVLALPKDENRWLSITDDAFILRQCCWWISLRGQPPTANQETQRIHIPKSQIFNMDALRAMMDKVKSGVMP